MHEPSTFTYDAFISYSRKDAAFAAALERALKRYRPPRGLAAPQRRLSVFRDQEDFTGVEYTDAVGRHLTAARKLIVVCSPNARQSRYVDGEIGHFAETHPAGDIVPIIIAGVPNNEAPADVDTAAFPDELCRQLAVPLASDYRGFDPRSHRIAAKQFRSAWYKLLADVLGCSRADVEERERRRRQRQVLVWGTTTSVVTASLAAAMYIADARGRTARSNALAGQASNIVTSDPELAALLALEAADQAETPGAISAVRIAVAQLPDFSVPVAPEADLSEPRAVTFVPGGERMGVADGRTPPRIIDLKTGTTSQLRFDGATSVSRLRWSPDGALIAAIDAAGNTIVVDAKTANPIARTAGELYWRSLSAGDNRPAVIAGERSIQIVELEKSGGWRLLRKIPFGGGVISPNAARAASFDEDTRRLTVLDLDSGRAISRTLEDGPPSMGLLWSPKGKYLVEHSLFGFTVIDPPSLATVFSVGGGNEILVEDVAVTNDETRLAATDRGGSTNVWSLDTRQPMAEFVGQEARAYTPVFSSDDRLLTAVYSNGRAELFQVGRGRLTSLTTFNAIAGQVVAAEFSPDGRYLLVQYENGPLALWSTDRWLPEHRLALDYGDADGVGLVRVTTDGSVVAVQKGNAVRSWNIASADESPSTDSASLQPLVLDPESTIASRRLSHEAEVQSAVTSPGGACILTASAYRMASGGAPRNSNVVRLWDAESATLLRQWEFDDFGPDAAFFGGPGRIVALFKGEGYVYRTPLCEPLTVLRELARRRVTRTLTGDERSRYLGDQPNTRREPVKAPSAPNASVASPVATPSPVPTTNSIVPRSPAPGAMAHAQSSSTSGPAFDCQRASTPVEMLICRDQELAAMDVDLARAYRAALDALQGDNRRRLIAEENEWIRSRATCAKAADMRACVERAYTQRLNQLRR